MYIHGEQRESTPPWRTPLETEKGRREGLPPFDRHGLILVPRQEKAGKKTGKTSINQSLEEDLVIDQIKCFRRIDRVKYYSGRMVK